MIEFYRGEKRPTHSVGGSYTRGRASKHHTKSRSPECKLSTETQIMFDDTSTLRGPLRHAPSKFGSKSVPLSRQDSVSPTSSLASVTLPRVSRVCFLWCPRSTYFRDDDTFAHSDTIFIFSCLETWYVCVDSSHSIPFSVSAFEKRSPVTSSLVMVSSQGLNLLSEVLNLSAWTTYQHKHLSNPSPYVS